MYQKITDGFKTFPEKKQKEETEKIVEQPMSYFKCPVCDNENLEKCECPKGGYLNYYCRMCQFKHINHHHKPEKSNQKMKDVDKAIISKSVRR